MSVCFFFLMSELLLNLSSIKDVPTDFRENYELFVKTEPKSYGSDCTAKISLINKSLLSSLL